jgi:hypothetical protein
LFGLKLHLFILSREVSMICSQNSVKSKVHGLSILEPANSGGVGADLTEIRIRSKISTLAGLQRSGNHGLGGNEVMGPVLTMRAEEAIDPLLSVEDVAERLNVSRDWVWDHSSRKAPYLPVIRMSDGILRYRASQIEEFVNERERLSSLGRKRR